MLSRQYLALSRHLYFKILNDPRFFVNDSLVRPCKNKVDLMTVMKKIFNCVIKARLHKEMSSRC
jgi:hypothetical protein